MTSTPTPPESSAEREHALRVAARHRRGTIRAYGLAIVAGLALDAIVVIIALLIGGSPSAAAALIGTGLALILSVPSLVPAVFALDRGPAAFGAVSMGTWLVKMIVLIAAVAAVRRIDGLEMPWVGVALLAGGLAALLTEAVVLVRQRAATGSL